MVEIEVNSPREIIDRLAEMANNYPDVVSDAIWMELSVVMNASKRICPWKTGALRGSGHVLEPEVSPGIIRATLGYSQSYAWWVHELTDNFHKPPAQAKFLEQPLTEALPDIIEKIVDRTVWLIKGGISHAEVRKFVKKTIGKD